MTKSFDLRTEPWITVRDRSGTHDMSIEEALKRASRIYGLSGDLPTVDLTILRLLLVILQRSLLGDRRAPTDQWAELWAADELPIEAINRYLQRHADRFDLFDPAAPFMQVAGLTAKGTSGLGKIIPDLPDGHPYFTVRAGESVQTLSAAESARYLLHCQAFDPSGIKTGVVGDELVKGGKSYPIGTGWSGRCGLVYFEGESLRETLLLNLVIRRPEADDEDDKPVWERPPLGPGIDRTHPQPVGTCDLWTWPSRRIRLIGDGESVTDVLLTNGDPIYEGNRQKLEPMTAWRLSDPQSKKFGHTVHMPQTHNPARAFWRGLASTLVSSGSTTDGTSRQPPELLIWMAGLVSDGLLHDDTPVRMRGVGVSYGSNNSVIDSIFDDALVLRTVVVADPEFRQAAIDAVEAAEAAVRCLADLGANIARAQGAGPDAAAAARERARARGYDVVGRRYVAWLRGLRPDSDLEERRTWWQRAVAHEVGAVGNRLVVEGGRDAQRGRPDDRGGWIDSLRSFELFRRAVRKSLPGAFPAEARKESADV